MLTVRRRFRLCAWLALVAILALAAGPTVSRMLLPAGGALGAAPAHEQHQHHHHHEMAMEAPAPAPLHAPAHEHSLEHCGLCLLAAHAVTPVQDAPALIAGVESARCVPDPIAPALPRLRIDWSPASSRGPPLHA